VWVLTLVLAVVVFFLLLLCIPFDFAIEYNSAYSSATKLNIGWFFNVVRIRAIGREKRYTRKQKIKKKKTRKPKNIRSRYYLKLLNKKVLVRIIRFVKNLLGCLHFYNIDIRLHSGSGNPALTGILYMELILLRTRYKQLRKIIIEPDFTEFPVLQGHAYAVVRIYPLQILTDLLLFVFSWPIIKICIQIFLLRWKYQA
jgi:hypothetical protein